MESHTLSHVLFPLGEELEPCETHLIPSIEVSQWSIMDILSDCIESPERHT